MNSTGMLKDRYGFWFWLKWILCFAGSFIAAAFFWTFVLERLFGPIAGPELEITWSITVLGSWFLLVIPFVRKKEQIWKRLNEDQERSVDAWFQGMSFLIAAGVASTLFWSFRMREAVLLEGFDREWLKRVGGTWLVALIPVSIFMYRRTDFIFLRADLRQNYKPGYQRATVPLEKRELSVEISRQLKKIPETLPHGHVVNVILKDGHKIPNVFIKYRREIAGVYDRPELGFETTDVASVEQMKAGEWSVAEESKWLRVDED